MTPARATGNRRGVAGTGGERRTKPPHRRVRGSGAPTYDSASFAEASALARELLAHRERPAAMAAHLARHPRQALRAAATVRALERIELELTGSPAGRELTEHLETRVLGVPSGWLAWGVLPIPPDRDRYLAASARRRQLFGRAFRDAGALGITWVTETDPDQQRHNLTAVLRERGWTDAALEEGVAPGKGLHVAALDAAGRAVGVGIALVDRRVAWLRLMLVVRERPLSSAVRYTLSMHILEALAGLGCEHLLVAHALTMPPGLQYFQQRLGFTPMNVVTVRGRGRGSRSSRP